MDFRHQIVTYYNNTRPGYGYDETIEEEDARKARTEINRLSQRALRYVYDTGVPCRVTYYPAPAVGGYVREIDMLANIFDLRSSSIPPQRAIDVLEQAIGVYEAGHRAAVIRTFNPFFWIGKGLRAISSFPFAILEHAGLHGRKLEDSFLGRLIKLLTQIVALLTAVLGFLKLVGKEDWITQFFK